MLVVAKSFSASFRIYVYFNVNHSVDMEEEVDEVADDQQVKITCKRLVSLYAEC